MKKDDIFYGLELDGEQAEFKEAMFSNEYDIVFCNAKAGTGKTLLSVACANILINKDKKYNKMYYLSIPVQEQALGFLPGTIEEKTSAYHQPLHDALIKINIEPHKAIIPESFKGKKSNDGWVEATTHVFLRGCNLDECIIVIEEAQNATTDQLKKMLTRVNPTCKVIVIGHSGQIDLRNKKDSGFTKYLEHFKEKEKCKICELTTNYRSWIAQWADGING